MPRSRILTFALALALAAAAPACSKKAEQLVGNEVLKRGADGLGTTVREVSPVDRDTYLATGTANRGTTLLAGSNGSFQAQTLLKVGTWVLPDTTDLTVVVDSIRLELPFDTQFSIPDMFLELRLAASPWDTTTVAWPGPGTGTPLASANAISAVPSFSLELGAASFNLVKSWAIDPTSLNGFIVQRSSGTLDVAAFRAGAGRFRIIYHTATSTRSVADTPLATDLFIHSPLTPAPTGADTTLILGGYYAPIVTFHVPIDSFTPGFSLDEARIVFRVRPDSPSFPESVTVEARLIQSPWLESASDTTGLNISTGVLDRVMNFRVRGPSDSLLIVPLPAALVRDWSSGAISNDGVVLRIGQSVNAHEIWLYSRESSRPPEFRISTTSPPPGRF